MPRIVHRLIVIAASVGLFVGLAATGAQPPSSGTANGEWRAYHGDLRQHHYSPLDQINAHNFGNLEVAWRFKTDSLGPRPEFKLEGTPLMVKGVVYTTAGTRRSVVALDAVTGELLWAHGEHEGKRGAVSPRQLSGRGLSYWSDGHDERVIYLTPGFRLVALDARTGALVASFGKNGLVDLKEHAIYGKGQPIDLETGEIGLHATPAVGKDVILVGSSFKEGHTPKTHNNTKGLVQAFDVRTGKRLWIFHTIPQPGEFGNDTWENESWAVNGNTGVWNQIAIDDELGLAYLPVETPTSDFYGGHRPGNNLFAESLVCVDLKTGKRKWHFQLVHHPIWNMDISTGPISRTSPLTAGASSAVSVDGQAGMIYTFDRVTGVPVWLIEERPVSQSDVPGEKRRRPSRFDQAAGLRAQRHFLDDVINFTPELHAEGVKLIHVQDRPGLYAQCDQQDRRSDRRIQTERDQRVRRRLRSRDARIVCPSSSAPPSSRCCRRRARSFPTSATWRAARSTACSTSAGPARAPAPMARRRRRVRWPRGAPETSAA